MPIPDNIAIERAIAISFLGLSTLYDLGRDSPVLAAARRELRRDLDQDEGSGSGAEGRRPDLRVVQ